MDKKHSGFEAPAIGTRVPDGTKWKKNPDGTISPVYPKKKPDGKSPKKKTAGKK